MKRWILVCAVALLAACGSSTEPKPTVAGRWTGVIGGQMLDVTLVENSGVVNGTGTITNTPTGTRALTITGTFANPAFTATMTSGTIQPINLSATVSGNQMNGTLNGSGFTGDAIILTRAS